MLQNSSGKRQKQNENMINVASHANIGCFFRFAYLAVCCLLYATISFDAKCSHTMWKKQTKKKCRRILFTLVHFLSLSSSLANEFISFGVCFSFPFFLIPVYCFFSFWFHLGTVPSYYWSSIAMQKRWRNGARERVREGTEQTVMASATTNVQPIRYVYVYVFVFICPKVFNKIKSIFSLTGIVPSSSLALFPFPSYHSIPPLLTWFADLLLDIRLLFLLVLYVFFFHNIFFLFLFSCFPVILFKGHHLHTSDQIGATPLFACVRGVICVSTAEAKTHDRFQAQI